MPKKSLEYGPMRVQVRPGSKAEKNAYARSALPQGVWQGPTIIAPGVNPAPLEDLVFHGGKVVPQMEFQNVYLGGEASWKESDISAIDAAIQRAMQYKRLNNVMQQYFPGAALSCEARQSFVLDRPKPAQVDENDVSALVALLYDKSLIKKRDLGTTLFNLILPSGTVLKLDGDSSLHGLGGYHGSTHIRRGGKNITLYYSANVYSEIKGGKENGIAVFNAPWKNVVGTLYHEINEFRTDADVNDAIAHNDNDYLGWTSRRGYEVGDQPISAANDLDLIFKEVSISKRKVPVQFMYSNAVHGAEPPIAKPHAA